MITFRLTLRGRAFDVHPFGEIPGEPTRLLCRVLGGPDAGAVVIVPRFELVPILTMTPTGEGFHACAEVPAIFRSIGDAWWMLDAHGVPVARLNETTIFRVLRRIDPEPAAVDDDL